MTERELAEIISATPREVPEEEVHRRERVKDIARGEYLPHGSIVHHLPDESRH